MANDNETMVFEQEFAKIPQNMGDYDELVARGVNSFGIKERVFRYGCEWESKVENNTYAPATLNESTGVITPDTTHWRHVSGSYEMWLVDHDYGKLSAANVKDVNQGNKSQQTINTEVGQKIADLETAVGTGGTVDQKIAVETNRAQNAESALGGRVTTLETAVGSGGSVDSRIAAAKAEIKGNATSACDTLGEAEALISAEASRAQAAEQGVTSRLDTQDAEIALLNGAEVIVVEDHTAVSSPDPQKIYREIGTSSYTDWMNQTGNANDWKVIATYNPGIDNEPSAGSNNLVKSGGVVSYTSIGIDVALPERIIRNAKVANHAIVENQPSNFHIDVIPVNFSKILLTASPNNGTWNDVMYAYDDELTQFSTPIDIRGSINFKELIVPSTAKYVLLTVNDSASIPAKLTVLDNVKPTLRSSLPCISSTYNSFVNTSGNIAVLSGYYYWHVERYNVRPFTRMLFYIPQVERTGALAIAFYSGEPSSATLISSYTTNNEERKVIYVPEKAICMLVTQYDEPTVFYVEDYNEEDLESKQNTGTRLYKEKSLAAALRWGNPFDNFHITVDGNGQADIIDGIDPSSPSLKNGYYFSADIVFEKLNFTNNEYLRLKAQGLVYPNSSNQTGVNIRYVSGNNSLIGNIECYIEPGTHTDIIHIITSGSNSLTQCFVENVKIQTLMSVNLGNSLFTELFQKRMPFVKVVNDAFTPSAEMVLFKNYRAELLTYESSRQKEIVLSSDHIVRKPLVFSGKSACFCGDSITKGYTDGTTVTENNYVKAFSEAVGLTYTNKAVGGATFTQIEGLAQIITQVQSITDRQYEYIFIAGGINDYQRNAGFDAFRTALNNLCDWVNTNLPSAKIIWITPINHAFDEGTGYLQNTYALWQYISIMVDVFVKKDTLYRFSIVKGHKFNFPVYGMDDTYINSVFGDRLHPSELGYQNVYAPGLLNALL